MYVSGVIIPGAPRDGDKSIEGGGGEGGVINAKLTFGVQLPAPGEDLKIRAAM